MPKPIETQRIFLEKLSKYLVIATQKRPDLYRINEVNRLKINLKKGHCSGIVALWLYYKHRNKETYFYDFIMKPILTWNEQESTLSKALEEAMEYALSSARWKQIDFHSVFQEHQNTVVNQSDYDILIGVIKQDDYPNLRKEYEIAFVFKKEELTSLLKDLPPNKLIRISSGLHAMGLFFDAIKKEYILFDPNGFAVSTDKKQRVFEKRFEDNKIIELVENIQKAFTYDVTLDAIGVSVSVFEDAQKPKSVYLDRVESIKQFLGRRFKTNGVAQVNLMTSKNSNALHFAALAGHLDTLDFLLKNGAQTNVRTTKGFKNPLDLASEKGHYFMVEKLLLHEKVAIESLNTALYSAVIGKHHNIVKLLLQKGAHLESIPKDALNVLHIAAREGDFFMLETLLNAPGAKQWIDETDIIDGVQCSPVYLAAENDHTTIIELLLRYGATIEISPCSKSPVHIAAEYGNINALKSLLNSKQGHPLIDVPLLTGETPIYDAAKNGHVQVVRFLLNQGADASHSLRDGSDVLYIAAKNGHWKVVEVLLSADKALLDRPLKDENTLLHIAAEQGDVEAVKYLLSCGADALALDKEEWNPIHIAARRGNERVVKELLDYQIGTELIDATTPYGRNALDLAQDWGHLEVIKLLKFAESKFKQAESECVTKAKGDIPRNWIDQDYPNLVKIRVAYLEIEQKINKLELEIMEISEYIRGLRDPITLPGIEVKMKRLEMIEHVLEHAKAAIHAKIEPIKINKDSRRKKLVAQSQQILSDLSSELLKDITGVRAIGHDAIQGFISKPSNKKTL